VQQTDPVPGELGAPEPLGLGLGGSREPRLGHLDHGSDDVRLPACVQVHAEPLVRLAGPLRAEPTG